MARVRDENQLGLDEELIENPDVEAALIERQARKDALGSVRKEFNEAHEKAVAALTAIELPDDGAVRVGRFRISKSIVSARAVSFETQESSRLRITLLGDTNGVLHDDVEVTDRDAIHSIAGVKPVKTDEPSDLSDLPG